ncbi:unnamed protein product [Mytilus edulis]|uniref:Uncharacterized protein n=1 Tax=Mytilus edulis TaxID=6550 RepID=A0A8S3T9G3_MYTED|nr:unnamed protein product [Mytilus edulis]
MHFGVPTSTSVTHTLSRSVNSAGTISSVPGTAMGLNLPGSRPPLSYCEYMLPNSGTKLVPLWSHSPWPQSYPYGGFMPNQPGFGLIGTISMVPLLGCTAPPLAPALPVTYLLTSAVAPSTTVPDSQASSSFHGTQVLIMHHPLDGLQKLLLDFGESFKAEFSTLSSPKSVECDEREDDELSVSPGSHERAFLTDEDVESSSSPKVSKTALSLLLKSAQQPPTKETEDPPSLKDLRDKVSLNSASEKVANNNISGFGMSSFSDQVKYKDFDIFDSSLAGSRGTQQKPSSVKVSVQVTNGKRSVNATSSSNSTSASGGPPSSAKKRKNNYGKPQNKPNNSGKAQFKNPPPLSAVPISFVSYTRPSQVSTSISRSGHYVIKSCNRGGVDLNSVSGFYSRLFLVPKKTGGMRPVM